MQTACSLESIARPTTVHFELWFRRDRHWKIFESIVMKQWRWNLCIPFFQGSWSRFYIVLRAFSRTKPALTYLPPFPTGACCDETPVGREVKHVLDPESDQNSGIEESHIQLLSRHVFGKEKMYEVLIVCQVIVVGKRLNCAMLCDWNMVLFYFFKREGLSKHHKPADGIHGKATMQRVNRYTCFLLLYRGQRLRSGSRDCRKSREIRPRGGQTFHFSRPQATGLSEKGVVAHSFHGCFNVNRHCRMLTHQLWTANLHKLSPWSCWSVASWRYVADFRACSTLI